MSSSPSTLSLRHFPNPSEQLCYVHCNICNTVLAVSVPCTSLFKTVTVRCGHCTNFLPVYMRGGLLLPSANQFHLAHSLFSASHNLLEGISNPSPNFLVNQTNMKDFTLPTSTGVADELPKPRVINRPPEKRQRVPSAYNRYQGRYPTHQGRKSWYNSQISLLCSCKELGIFPTYSLWPHD